MIGSDMNRPAAAPCRRRHPGWRDGLDYGRQAEPQGVWHVARTRLFARHIDHESSSFDGPTTFPPGAVVRYLGTNYVYDTYSETADHIFQVLDAGPGFAGEGVDPLLRTPLQVGDCYEVSEYIDDDTFGRWWPSVLAPVLFTTIAP
jgi:hypothetical protein